MLDIKFIREHKDIVAAGAKKKHIAVDLDRLLQLDDKRRELQVKVDEKRAEQNTASDSIAKAPGGEREKMIAQMTEVKKAMQQHEEALQEVLKEWRALMLTVPNVPDISVPEGESDEQNQEIRNWGKKTEFKFDAKNHVDLMLMHDMADFERGAKVAGFRGYFLKNDGARLMWALERFVQDRFTSPVRGAGNDGNSNGEKASNGVNRHDFTPLVVPSLVRKEPFIGTGFLPQSEEDLYKTQDGDYLAGTAEVGGMGYYMNEMLDVKELPIKFFAFSPCFRREVGSYGRDTKGLFRIHEFFKYEQIVLCEASHEVSVAMHEELTQNSEKLVQELGLPYRVVVNCGGDLGLGQVKKYDIEAWMPSEGRYRETHSSSYFHDFQTRRLNIRYRDTSTSLGAGAQGTVRYAHSLNNTALAMPRILCQIVENNQQKDGSILIPEVLRPYMGREKILPRN